jgi:hypothetical protein
MGIFIANLRLACFEIIAQRLHLVRLTARRATVIIRTRPNRAAWPQPNRHMESAARPA